MKSSWPQSCSPPALASQMSQLQEWATTHNLKLFLFFGSVPLYLLTYL